MIRSSTLQGFNIPGAPQKLIVKMFADDTTIYLSEKDDYNILMHVLNKWCKGSRAKFNIEKTVVIPIGSEEYRAEVRETKKINANQIIPIEDDIDILMDNESTRILGGRTGNKMHADVPWAPVLEKIDKALAQWNRLNPTMDGRKIIIQWIIGGMTQFLTTVQGMPEQIEKRLEKRICTFLWNHDGVTRVNMKTLQTHKLNGGKGVLNIVARNEAIELMWVKTYLNLSGSRATWAHVADELINRRTNKTIEHLAKINIFLQGWSVPTSKGTELPEDL
ncbi:hypothetical protein FISHEDRAFT_36011 [Fistulina hepatica ATCC 64428]|uniref:Reverse transcriptase domain-containing protein n=1 Tax=Fistulina hepatica ATCC 64428 TaxID=1128425 RepID=A0A0D7AMM0_9AGAR|nr:hypothetical protein FISHEDRAFT_36011 [Fistulina hepatica ATCC 64428]